MATELAAPSCCGRFASAGASPVGAALDILIVAIDARTRHILGCRDVEAVSDHGPGAAVSEDVRILAIGMVNAMV